MAADVLSPASIEITHLSKIYGRPHKTEITAVDYLDLSIPKGQIFGFLGSNGAGKTTTIKMICGLVTPTTGTIRVNGYDVAHQRGAAMRQIGVVLEGTRNVYWRLSAWQNLLYFGHLKDQWGKSLRMRAEELLRDFDLWDRRNDPLRTFSRGMQQKVAISCALIADPPIILLDEPTLGLDVHAARTMKSWVNKLAREQNKTVILTTHQLDMAQELCDRVAIMSKGQLLTNKPLNELLEVFQQECYQIQFQGQLSDQTQFPHLTLEEDGENMQLTGVISSRAELHQYLCTLYDQDVTLLGVKRVEPNLEEIFVRLLSGGEKEEDHDHRIVSVTQ